MRQISKKTLPLSGMMIFFLFASSARAMSAPRFLKPKILNEATYKIAYDSTKLNVVYGQNFNMNLWTQIEKGSLGQVVWSIAAGGLPEGLILNATGPQSASITGQIRFLGQWCLSLAAQASKQRVEESFCLKSSPKEHAPPLVPSQALPKGSTGKTKFPWVFLPVWLIS